MCGVYGTGAQTACMCHPQTGIEIAAEAAEAGGGGAVTLAHSGAAFGRSAKQHAVISERLRRQNVEVLLNESATPVPGAASDAGGDGGPRRFKFENAEREFDAVFWCTGSKPNGKKLGVDALGEGVLTDAGHFAVNKHLQVRAWQLLPIATFLPAAPAAPAMHRTLALCCATWP
jgi:pyruvate/2-oxoglutarate dehydrogenase complex dihydrolipoamide dehydrogenase (E3) component